MADDGQQPDGALVVAKEVDRSEFVETFTVREKGRRYEVAANAIANRAMMQVNVAKLRNLFERALKPFEDNPDMIPSPSDLKRLADAAELIESMSSQAYSDAKGGTLANSLERLVYAAAKGGAQGAKPGDNKSPEARLRRMTSLIGKAKPVTPAGPEIIDVEPENK